MLKTCIICGNEFQTTNPAKKCCSPECSKIAHRLSNRAYSANHREQINAKQREHYRKTHQPKTYIKTCPICGNVFETKRSIKRFCEECAKKVESDRIEKRPTVRACITCGKIFSGFGTAKYCSEQCKTLAYKDKTVYIPESGDKSLEQWATEAAMCHMSYGQYRAAIANGKSFEELRMC